MPKKYLYILLFFFQVSSAYADVNIDFSYASLKHKFLNQYPTIKNSEYDLDLAILAEEKVKYSEYPTFRLNMSGFPLMVDVYKEHGGAIGIDPSQWKPGFGTTIRMGVPLATFGRLTNGKKAAKEKKLATEQKYFSTKNNVLVTLKKTYWYYLSYNSFQKYVFSVTLKELSKIVKDREKKFNQGLIDRKSLEQARLDYLSINNQITIANKYKEDVNNNLALLSDKSYLDTLNIHFKVKYIFPLEIDLKPFEFYLDKAREKNPDLKAAYHYSLADKYYTKAKHANIWPVLSFGASLTYNYYDFDYPKDGDSLFPDNGFGFGLGFSLNWDIDVWTQRNSWLTDEKKHLKNIESLKKASLMFEKTLKDSYSNLKLEMSNLKYKEEVLKISKRTLILTNNAESTGVSKDSDISNAVKQLFNNLKSYYLEIEKYNMAVAKFEKALGEEIVNYEKQEAKEIEKELYLEDDSNE